MILQWSSAGAHRAPSSPPNHQGNWKRKPEFTARGYGPCSQDLNHCALGCTENHFLLTHTALALSATRNSCILGRAGTVYTTVKTLLITLLHSHSFSETHTHTHTHTHTSLSLCLQMVVSILGEEN